MNMTFILFAFSWYYKGQTYWSVTAEKWGEVSRLLDNLDAGVVVHAADTVIMSNINTELLASTVQPLGKKDARSNLEISKWR
jgi:hypothetical protein